jgi:hypothetical protein
VIDPVTPVGKEITYLARQPLFDLSRAEYPLHEGASRIKVAHTQLDVKAAKQQGDAHRSLTSVGI